MSKKFKDSSRLKKIGLDLKDETKKEIVGVLMFVLALIVILSALSAFNLIGTDTSYLSYLYKGLGMIFGAGFFLVPLGLILGGVAIFRSLHEDIFSTSFIGIGIFILGFLGLLQIFISDGGYLGLIVTYPFITFLGKYASFIIFVALIIIALLITFNFSLKNLFNKLFGKKDAKEKLEFVKNAEQTKHEIEQPSAFNNLMKKIMPSAKFEVKGIGEQGKENKQAPESEKPVKKDDFMLLQSKMVMEDYKFPALDLLEADSGEPTSGDIKANANIVKRTLQHFGIEVEMAEVNIGPTVTQYTFRPAQGIKLSKITTLQDDLSLALAAHPIRIEAPIPGRSLVGIEIPNRAVTRVRLRNLVEQEEFRHNHKMLTIALGRDVAGNPVYADLERMPHLLIAGATGTGKTICLNSIIVSLLYRQAPNFLKLILIDPKRVEFPVYNGLPHLLTPVIVNSDKTVNALRWAVGEMERRFETLSAEQARDILTYNQKFIDGEVEEPLPYITIIVDELADLMASHGREVEASIVRLAQMSRAVGIHLVLATQRPSVEVITGLIKANITSRIAFQVASNIDSRTILDAAGAEKLLGNGDMLFLSGDVAKPRRIQGTYTSDREVKKIAEFLTKQNKAEYAEDITQAHAGQSTIWGESVNGEGIDDDLYGQAKELVIHSGKASASLLQRHLRVGYARAARIIDTMEKNGVVGPGDGAKPREILVGEAKNIPGNPKVDDDEEIIDNY